MKLGTRIFLSHGAVVVFTILVVSIVAFFVTPSLLETEEQTILRTESGQMETIVETNDVATTQFSSAIGSGLLVAAFAALSLAAIVSWAVSRWITRPLRQISTATQIIADGRYDLEVEVDTNDEVGELAQHVNAMASALDATEKTRRQLLADVTHELKTPLMSIRGYMEGLQDDVIEASNETYQLVYDEADRLHKLVQSLQSLSQIESPDAKLKLQSISIHEPIRAAITRLQPQFDAKNVALEYTAPESHIILPLDSDRILQVMLNVLGNALHYTPTGGEVWVRVQETKQHVDVQVQDTGVGIAPEHLDAIFQRFYRVDASRVRSTGGTGIGLTIAKHLMQAHGGRIWAESQGLGKGTTITLRFTKT